VSKRRAIEQAKEKHDVSELRACFFVLTAPDHPKIMTVGKVNSMRKQLSGSLNSRVVLVVMVTGEFISF